MSNQRSVQHLETPWDTVLGARSQVRVIRVLEQAREPMAVREVSRRAGEYLRAVQIAISRLLETGIVHRIGTGKQQLVQWNSDHPLSPALSSLFIAERERHERIVDDLAQLAREHARKARTVWMREDPGRGGPTLRIGVLAGSINLDSMVDSLREALTTFMRDEDLTVEVRGWTLADLELSDTPIIDSIESVRLLWGNFPSQLVGPARLVGEDEGQFKYSRSHQDMDEQLRTRAIRITEALQCQPELVRLAREEIANRLESAPPQEARTLREWQQVLEGMSLPRLMRWLVDEGEQATRLRQSIPLVFLKSIGEGTKGG